jgi:hypothetical protein
VDNCRSGYNPDHVLDLVPPAGRFPCRGSRGERDAMPECGSQNVLTYAAMRQHPWQAVTMPLPVDADSEFLGWALWTAKEARELAFEFFFDELCETEFAPFFYGRPASSPIGDTGIGFDLATARVIELEQRLAALLDPGL